MSTPATVPVFDPQGVLRDVPQEHLVDAVKSGRGMPAVRFQAPDGKIHFVPANRIQEAVAAKGKILPIEDQDVQHPGFWSTLIDDAKSLGKSLLNAGPEMGSGDQIHQDAEYQQKLISEGRSLPYRMLMSLTPNGMRESAESGDVGGVVGHTVVPAAAAASPLAAEGASRVVGSAGNAAKGAANSVRPAASSALRTVSDVVSPDVTGVFSPRIANAQRLAGKLADALAQKPVYPGAPLPEHPGVFPGAPLPEHPGVFPGAPLPTAPPREVLQASSLARGPQPVVDPAAGLGQIPARYTPPSMAEAKPVEPAAPTVAKRAPRGAAAGAQNFKAIQQAQALREQTPNIVDQAIPPEVSKGENAAAKIQVDEALKKGDVAAAEEVLSRRAKNAGLQWPPDAPVSRGSTNDIRANLPGNRAALRADQLDTHGIQQEMAQDLERHGQMAESDARKEFIARNSFDTTKGQLIKDSKIAQPDEDLTDVLQKSIEEANRKRAAQLNAKP